MVVDEGLDGFEACEMKDAEMNKFLMHLEILLELCVLC